MDMELRWVKIADIHDLDNIRDDYGNLEELAATFEGGQPIQPPVVCPNGAEGSYRVVVGSRRLAALRQRGDEEALVLVRERPANLSIAKLMENLARKALNGLEEGRAFLALTEREGISQAELARRIGVSPAYISRRIALLDLAPQVQEMVTDGRLTASAAEEVADSNLTVGQQAELARRLANKAKVTGNMVRAAMASIVAEGEAEEPDGGEEWLATDKALVRMPSAECAAYKLFYEAGNNASQVGAYQTLQFVLNDLRDLLDVSWSKMTPDLRQCCNHKAAEIIKEARLIEEMTR